MNTAVATTQPKSVTGDMALRYGMEHDAFESVVRKTCMPSNVAVSKEEFAAFLLVSKELGLNPVSKEIFAYPKKGGGIQAIVSIDGWMKLINQHPQFDGMEFRPINDEKGVLIAMECAMWRKDRSRPVKVIEYLDECRRNTEPWKQMPARMLRHKTAIQCSRYCIGFAGIMDEDEYERMVDVTPPSTSGVAARVASDDHARAGFDADQIRGEIGRKVITQDPALNQPEEEHDPETGELGAEENGGPAQASEPDRDEAAQDGGQPDENEPGESQPENEERAKLDWSHPITQDEKDFLNTYYLALNRATKAESLPKLKKEFMEIAENAATIKDLSAAAKLRAGRIYDVQHQRWNEGLKATEAYEQVKAIIST